MVTRVPPHFLLIAGGVSTVYFSLTSQRMGEIIHSHFKEVICRLIKTVFITHMF